MKFFENKRNLWLIAAVIAGALLLGGGYKLASFKNGQVDYYNQGLKAYENGDMPTAIKLFDQSIASYRRELSAGWTHRFIYPKPSRELAAMASFQKAKALLQNRQAEQAVEAFKDSLKLNPGDEIEGLDPEDALRMREEALVVKYDLELLFKSRPDLAQGQGKGKGKGQGQGNKQAPGNEPGSQPGKGNRDDI